MEDPLSRPDSQPESLNEPATDNTSLDLNEAVKPNEPQIITEPAEESRPQTLDKEATEDSLPVHFSKPDIIVEPPREESRSQNLNEQAKDHEPQNQPTQHHGPQDLNEAYEETKGPDLNQIPPDNEPYGDSKEPDLNQFTPDNEPYEDTKGPDLNQFAPDNLDNKAEVQDDAPQKTVLDVEESLLPPSSEGQEITTTDDVTARKPSLDDDALGLLELAADHQPQAFSTLIDVEEPEQHPQFKKPPTYIFTTDVQENTIRKEKVEEAPGWCKDKRASQSAKSMSSWSPSQYAKGTLHQKPKPHTADKATQILPGRVPKLPPPPRVPKPKFPSADKTTEISPSFEKLVKRPPPPLIKKKKKEEISPLTWECHHGTGLPKKRRSYISYRGTPPRAAAKSPPPRVKSSKSKPLHVKSSKIKPRRVKSAKSMPLRVKLSSSSASKHRLNLSFSPRKKREVICNLYINFCDNWDKSNPCCLRQTHWEESLSSCSGLYRACSVFSFIKYGRIHVSNLLLALHTLGILVTSAEIHHILCLTDVDQHNSLNFCEFLEAVKITSPFAETASFQNTLKAFRKMKKGTVTVEELEPILLYLGITLSPEAILQTLGRIKLNRNGKFDISDFLLAAKDLQQIFEEEEEAFLKERTIFRRRPFQDVADLVDVERRRRRKFHDCFDDEMPMPSHLLPLRKWQESDEDIVFCKQQFGRTSNTDLSTPSPVSITITKEEAKDGDAMEITTPQTGLSSDLKSSSPEPLVNKAKEGNKDNDAMELGKSQMEPPNQNTKNPVPA